MKFPVLKYVIMVLNLLITSRFMPKERCLNCFFPRNDTNEQGFVPFRQLMSKGFNSSANDLRSLISKFIEYFPAMPEE